MDHIVAVHFKDFKLKNVAEGICIVSPPVPLLTHFWQVL